jgi:hypothetical protein
MTVSGDTFRTDAVFSTLSPPKNRNSTTRLFRVEFREPRDRFPVDQADIGFIDERRCLQAVSHALSRHAASRDLVQLLMDQRDQSFAGSLVALPPFEKERGDIRGVFSNPPIVGALLAPRWNCLSRTAVTSNVASLLGPGDRTRIIHHTSPWNLHSSALRARPCRTAFDWLEGVFK